MGKTVIKAGKTLLWKHSTPGEAIGEFTINVDLSNYSIVEIQFMAIGAQCIYSFKGRIGKTISPVIPWGNYLTVRAFTIESDHITVGNGGYYTGYNSGTVNYASSYAVPYAIYGIK